MDINNKPVCEELEAPCSTEKLQHDIRSPLSGVLGFSRLALDTDSIDEKDEYLQKIFDCGRQILSLIDSESDYAVSPDSTECGQFNYSLPDNITVLVCEDNKLTADLLVKSLNKLGCEAECASNGAKGLEMFVNSNPGHFDAIIMDIFMPVKDGITATREIRGLNRADATLIPIIGLSGSAGSDDIAKATAAGIDTYILKPVRLKHLYDTLKSLIV